MSRRDLRGLSTVKVCAGTRWRMKLSPYTFHSLERPEDKWNLTSLVIYLPLKRWGIGRDTNSPNCLLFRMTERLYVSYSVWSSNRVKMSCRLSFVITSGITGLETQIPGQSWYSRLPSTLRTRVVHWWHFDDSQRSWKFLGPVTFKIFMMRHLHDLFLKKECKFFFCRFF